MAKTHILFDIDDDKREQIRSIIRYADRAAMEAVNMLRETDQRAADGINVRRLSNFLAGNYLREGEEKTVESIVELLNSSNFW